MRSYLPIWERIRANPGRRVPIEVPAIYLPRLVNAMKKEKNTDIAYKNARTAQGKTGVVYKSTAPHPTKPGYIVCTYILREFSVVLGDSDKHSVVKKEPPMPEVLAKELDMVAFDFVPSTSDIINAKMQIGMELQALIDKKPEPAQTQTSSLSLREQLLKLQERIK